VRRHAPRERARQDRAPHAGQVRGQPADANTRRGTSPPPAPVGRIPVAVGDEQHAVDSIQPAAPVARDEVLQGPVHHHRPLGVAGEDDPLTRTPAKLARYPRPRPVCSGLQADEVAHRIDGEIGDRRRRVGHGDGPHVLPRQASAELLDHAKGLGAHARSRVRGVPIG
jgi:hypothetical protein